MNQITELEELRQKANKTIRAVAIKECVIIALTSAVAHQKSKDYKGAEVSQMLANKMEDLLL